MEDTFTYEHVGEDIDVTSLDGAGPDMLEGSTNDFEDDSTGKLLITFEFSNLNYSCFTMKRIEPRNSTGSS